MLHSQYEKDNVIFLIFLTYTVQGVSKKTPHKVVYKKKQCFSNLLVTCIHAVDDINGSST